MSNEQTVFLVEVNEVFRGTEQQIAKLAQATIRQVGTCGLYRHPTGPCPEGFYDIRFKLELYKLDSGGDSSGDAELKEWLRTLSDEQWLDIFARAYGLRNANDVLPPLDGNVGGEG